MRIMRNIWSEFRARPGHVLWTRDFTHRDSVWRAQCAQCSIVCACRVCWYVRLLQMCALCKTSGEWQQWQYANYTICVHMEKHTRSVREECARNVVLNFAASWMCVNFTYKYASLYAGGGHRAYAAALCVTLVGMYETRAYGNVRWLYAVWNTLCSI